MRRKGYVNLHHQIEDWEWYKDLVVRAVFTDLLICASYQENSFQGHPIKVGQVATSYSRLAERNGITQKQVRGAFDKLKKTGEITTERAHRFTIVTIVNWGKFQLTEENRAIKKAVKGQSEGSEKAVKGQHYKNIKKEKGKKEKEIGASPASLSSSMTKEEYDAWWRDATE